MNKPSSARRHWSPAPAMAMAMLACLAMGAAQAQTYPSKPVRFIIPFAPGGGSDILSRAIGQKLAEAWGQPVVIDNRPGANGVIGQGITAKASPDGHTVILDTTAFVLNPLFNRKLPFDPERDFAPVSMPAAVWHVLIAHPSVAAAGPAELVAQARAPTAKLSLGSFGLGSTGHLAAELMNQMAGTRFVHVPYKGGGPAITAVIGNEVQLAFVAVPPALPHVASGRIKALGVSAPRRVSELAGVPAIAEAIPGFEVSLWWAFLAPAGVPREIVEKLNRELTRIVTLADVRERLAPQGFEFRAATPAELATFIRAERAKWAKLVQTAGIRLE